MAHDCPDCGMQCHCNGDIDDINFGESDECICCIDKYDDHPEDDDMFDEDEDDYLNDIRDETLVPMVDKNNP